MLRNKGSGQVVGLDILPTEPIPGAVLIQQDFTAADAADKLKRLLDGKADIVMSDMAANTIGHQQTDHLRTMALVELAYDLPKTFWPRAAFLLPKSSKAGRKQVFWRK